MEALVGLKGCRRTLFVLASQLTLLIVAMAASLFLIFTYAEVNADGSRSAAVLAALVLPLAVIATVYATLTALLEPIELLFSINAKRRLKTWVLPALVVGGAVAAAGIVAAFFYYGVGSAASLPPTAFWSLGVMEALAYAVPLAALGLFGAASVKRYLGMRESAASMTRSLEPVGSEKSDSLARVRLSVATEIGTATTSVRPNPQGFTLAGLTSRPFHDPASFSWMRAFDEKFDEIRAEAEAVLNIHRDHLDKYKYPGLDGDQWQTFNFIARHKPNEANLKLCPVTAALLKTVPGYPVFRDAMFSILGPGGEISPHRDQANIFLTAHLGLLTPAGGFVEVAGRARPWRKGEFLVFDSSYEHRAVNPSDSPRVVLLIDFVHPEITARELAWIQEIGL